MNKENKRVNVWNQSSPSWKPDWLHAEPPQSSTFVNKEGQQVSTGGGIVPPYRPVEAPTFTVEQLGIEEPRPQKQGVLNTGYNVNQKPITPEEEAYHHQLQVIRDLPTHGGFSGQGTTDEYRQAKKNGTLSQLEQAFRYGRQWPGSDKIKTDGGAIGWLADSMGHYTTPEEEERYRKRARNKAAILAVGDALRHIGNIYYTSQYAMPQQYNQPVTDAMTKYVAEKANRDNVNYRLEKIQREAEKIKADADFKNRQLANQADYNKGRLEEATRHNKANEGVAQGRVDETVRHNKENEGIARGRAEETARHNSVTERQGAQRIAIQKGNADETRRHHAVMESRGSSTGGGRGGRKTEPYHISSGRTTLGRSKELSKQETDDIYNYLMRNKKIHPDTDRNVRGVRVVKDKNGNPIINPTTGKPMETKAPKKYTKREVIEFALYNDPSFGNYLINEYGYTLESGTLEAPRKPTRPAAEKNTRQQNARKETIQGNAFSKYGGTQITSK